MYPIPVEDHPIPFVTPLHILPCLQNQVEVVYFFSRNNFNIVLLIGVVQWKFRVVHLANEIGDIQLENFVDSRYRKLTVGIDTLPVQLHQNAVKYDTFTASSVVRFQDGRPIPFFQHLFRNILICDKIHALSDPTYFVVVGTYFDFVIKIALA